MLEDDPKRKAHAESEIRHRETHPVNLASILLASRNDHCSHPNRGLASIGIGPLQRDYEPLRPLTSPGRSESCRARFARLTAIGNPACIDLAGKRSPP